MVLAVALAVVLVSVVSIDLGPALKARAERAGGNWLDRGLHIGRLGVQLGRGRFVIEDLVIDGMRPGRGSLARRQARRGVPHLGRLFRREVLLDTHRDARLADGRRELSRMAARPSPASPVRRGRPAPGHRRSSPRCKYVRAWRGEFVYRDFGSNWSAITRNLDVNVAKATEYRGVLRFADSTITIQNYVPMTAAGGRHLQGAGNGQVVFDRMRARHRRRGERRDRDRRPRQAGPSSCTTSSRGSSSRGCARSSSRPTRSTLHGEGEFDGHVPLFKGGRELKGKFYSRGGRRELVTASRTSRAT